MKKTTLLRGHKLSPGPADGEGRLRLTGYVMGSERPTGALLDRLTHRVHILEANGESYRLKEAKKHRRKPLTKTPSES